MTTSINIIQPDDWHVHFREDEMLKVVTKYSARVNRRCIAMPNTLTPITSSNQAINYKKLIESNSQSSTFEALIPCYLTDSLNIDDFTYALQNKIFIGGKLYPSNATTNSQHGVNDIKKIYNIFEILELIRLIAIKTPFPKYFLLFLSLFSNASKVPVDAPEGHMALALLFFVKTSASIVGLPLLSKT